MIGEIIAIGDELISGSVLNTTSHFAASQLFAAGHEVVAMTSIGDDAGLIGATLNQAMARADFVVVTGGLGPTSDDLTNEAVSSALNRPATFHPEILRKLKENGCDGSGLEKLAWLPQGAHSLHTEAMSAGYFLVQQGKPVFFLPGVPHEMKELLLETVITRLSVWEGDGGVRQVRRKLYKVTGLPESVINRKIGHLPERDPRVRVGYYPVFPEVQVSLTVTAASEREAEVALARADAQVTDLLGQAIYGFDGDTLEGVVGALLDSKGQTLAVAESCTGGLLGHTVTRAPGSSAYFLGGAVVYSNTLKERLLGVDREILLRHGAVSRETARAMADGVRRITAADYAVAITGIAGPSGGSAEKPVGTVCFGIAGPEKSQEFRFRFSGERWQVQAMAAHTGLDLLRRHLLGIPVESDLRIE
ncbi:MAG: CinA family nicotinamide mononucleotide deamidase-related protein [Thermodesulfobacteriota bacterium]